MSICHSLLLGVFSFLLCPAASQMIGYTPKEVKSGHCTDGLVLYNAADCKAAAKVLGLGSTTMYTASRDDIPPGCSWSTGFSRLYFNTNQLPMIECGDGTNPGSFKDNPICICGDPCPIGNYQNEESIATCKSCLPGTYNDETGKALCKGCSDTDGQYSSEVGQTSCKGGSSTAGSGSIVPDMSIYCLWGSDCDCIKIGTFCLIPVIILLSAFILSVLVVLKRYKIICRDGCCGKKYSLLYNQY